MSSLNVGLQKKPYHNFSAGPRAKWVREASLWKPGPNTRGQQWAGQSAATLTDTDRRRRARLGDLISLQRVFNSVSGSAPSLTSFLPPTQTAVGGWAESACCSLRLTLSVRVQSARPAGGARGQSGRRKTRRMRRRAGSAERPGCSWGPAGGGAGGAGPAGGAAAASGGGAAAGSYRTLLR